MKITKKILFFLICIVIFHLTDKTIFFIIELLSERHINITLIQFRKIYFIIGIVYTLLLQMLFYSKFFYNYKEKVCSRIHRVWGDWYLYQKHYSTDKNIRRWNRQSNMDYENLSEEDKDKDRVIYERLTKDL